MKTNIITTTGYYKTGSTAVYCLLREYDSCTTGVAGDSDYEHLILYTPNGVFTLEDKLLSGNNIHRSDEALRSFRNEMCRLNDNDFIWFGNYKKLIGEGFMKSVDKYIDSLTDVTINCRWSYDYLTTKFSFKRLLGSIRNMVLKRPIRGEFLKTIVFRKKNITRYSYVTEAEFCSKTEVFTDEYFNLIRNNKNGHLLLDHFVLPTDVGRLDKYLGKLKVIIVDRDPRDVYIHIMNEVKSNPSGARVPYKIDEFIYFWKSLRKMTDNQHCDNVLFIKYEDMFYKYDKTVRAIEDFCGLDSKSHVNIHKYFNPQFAEKYLQTFKKCHEYTDEIKKIERELSEYLYDFQY